MLAPEEYTELPPPERRWNFDAYSMIGPSFVHLNVGVRLTVADTAVALFVGLVFVEIMVQYNRGKLRGTDERP